MPRSRIPSSASNADTIMGLQTAAASDRAAGLNQTHSARVLVVCYSRKGFGTSDLVGKIAAGG